MISADLRKEQKARVMNILLWVLLILVVLVFVSALLTSVGNNQSPEERQTNLTVAGASFVFLVVLVLLIEKVVLPF